MKGAATEIERLIGPECWAGLSSEDKDLLDRIATDTDVAMTRKAIDQGFGWLAFGTNDDGFVSIALTPPE